MCRRAILAVVGALILNMAPAAGSPVKGHYREPVVVSEQAIDRAILNPHATYTFSETFRGNERACIIIEGDHKPVMDLRVTVKDPFNNVVAQDTAGGDFVSVIWYPPRTQAYTISITGNGNVENYLYIVVK